MAPKRKHLYFPPCKCFTEFCGQNGIPVIGLQTFTHTTSKSYSNPGTPLVHKMRMLARFDSCLLCGENLVYASASRHKESRDAYAVHLAYNCKKICCHHLAKEILVFLISLGSVRCGFEQHPIWDRPVVADAACDNINTPDKDLDECEIHLCETARNELHGYTANSNSVSDK